MSAATGPHYIFKNGDIWLAGIANRSWYGKEKYLGSYGTKIDTSYDWSRKVSSSLNFQFLDNLYDEYGEWMNGQSYTLTSHVSYVFDSVKYVFFRGKLERVNAKLDAFANNKYGFSIGFVTEMHYGFRVSLEPSFLWINYDGERYIKKGDIYQPTKEKSFVQQYTMSLANTEFDIKGLIPLITVSYIRKDSNIESREYDKGSLGISLKRKF